ncbi:MAG: hypothetical protein K2N53_06030 [Clostridia bacterium]|nr:hypothetical protein [Clostridia bacterium]
MLLDENGLPIEITKSHLSEEQKSVIVRKKMRMAKTSIVTGVLTCWAFFVCIAFVILAFIDIIDFQIETIIYLMFIVMVVASIIGGVCSSRAKAKVNREQVLEGKNLKCVKACVIMSRISMVLCAVWIELYFILIFSLIYFGSVGFWSII